MILEQILSGAMQNFVYLIGDENSGKAAIIDPAQGSRQAVKRAEELGVELELVLLTHSHSDHTTELPFFRGLQNIRVAGYPNHKQELDISLSEGQTLELGELVIKVLHTPGHTPDSLCYLAEGNLFTGDTLFIAECGRTDFPGGSSRELYHSIFYKLMALPDDTVIWPGHHYGAKPFNTLKEEKESSYILEKRTEDEFVKFMGSP